jgi:hypothetical protein
MVDGAKNLADNFAHPRDKAVIPDNRLADAMRKQGFALSTLWQSDPTMLTDRYDLALFTTSAAARDVYVQGCKAQPTIYPGAREAFERAITAAPGFALCSSGEPADGTR